MSSKHIAIVRGRNRGLEVLNEPRVLGMPNRTGVYRFGLFQLDVRERRLLRDGAQVPLRLKAFETLRVLVENAGRLVTKEMLLKVAIQTTHCYALAIALHFSAHHAVLAAVIRSDGKTAVGPTSITIRGHNV